MDAPESFFTLYDLLQVSEAVTADELKAAYRQRAFEHHPDRHNDSPESEAAFKAIARAYEVLSDDSRRREYDATLRASRIRHRRPRVDDRPATVRPATVRPAAVRKAERRGTSVRSILGQLNFLLWEIEDFLSAHSDVDPARSVCGATFAQWLLEILVFIDQWILVPAGYRDYFLEARGMSVVDMAKYFSDIRKNLASGSRFYGAYVDVTDYFYAIRKRADRFMNRAMARDLLVPVGVTGRRVVDFVFEAQNLGIHYLTHLGRLLSGEAAEVPKYRSEHFPMEIPE